MHAGAGGDTWCGSGGNDQQTMSSSTERMPEDWANTIANSSNPFLTAISRYARAPIAFVREVLHAEPDAWQLDVLRALAKGHTRIAIRSAHGVGKTCVA